MSARYGSGVAFLFGYFLFTPGILPYALRASFAVRMRILRMREHAKRKWLALRKEGESFCSVSTIKSKSIAHDRRKSLVDRVRSYKEKQEHRG